MASLETAEPTLVDAATIKQYRREGFVTIRNIISPDEAETFRQYYVRILADEQERQQANSLRPVFTQMVNLWTRYPELKGLCLHPRITAAAKALAGVPLRLWHDHLLVKEAHSDTPTQFHQDQPYWPHQAGPSSANSLSCWIALCDVPVERGCMSFINGSHRHTDVPVHSLDDQRDLFGKCPEMAWSPYTTVPLKAGDCTFHHSRCAHMAGGNRTADPRIALSVIYMDQTTRLSERPHCVTSPLDLQVGDVLEGDSFPEL